MKAAPLLAAVLSVTTPCAFGAVTLLQTENFDTLGGWTRGGPNPNPPAILADSGPLGGGDSALRVIANGGGAGGRLVTFNRTTTWTGDFSGEGIDAIAADLRNLGTSALSVRIAFNGPGGWWITAAESVPAFAGWGSHLFDIRATSLVASDGATSAAATLADVTEMRILHSPNPDHTGVALSGTMLIDNITAVPEPSPLILLAWSPLLLKRKRPFAKNAIP